MRRGDVLSVRLTAVADATRAELRAIERIQGTLSVELCMRKRKRVDEFAEEGEAAQMQTEAAQGRASKASRRRERKRRVTRTSVPAEQTTGSRGSTEMSTSTSETDHIEARACSESDHTGSDTEWSEGFSSDDEERRKARPPKRMRRLARELREVNVTNSDVDGVDDEGADGSGDGGAGGGDNDSGRTKAFNFSDGHTGTDGDQDSIVACRGTGREGIGVEGGSASGSKEL